MTQQPREVIKDWIEAVNDEGHNLSEWEQNFMESITEQFDSGSNLSATQRQILERIYTEKVP